MTTGSHRELSVAIPSRSSLSDSDICVCNMIGGLNFIARLGLEVGGGVVPLHLNVQGGVGWKVAANQLPPPLIWSSAAKLLRQI